jgi:hypothetical protein
VLNVPLMFVPIELMIVTRPTVIKLNITAYSIAVGPSSPVRKRLMREANLFIGHSLSEQVLNLRSDKQKTGRTHRHSGQAVRMRTDHDEPRVLLTVLNVPLMLVPSAPTTETIATTIKASITAYSTAVGPSSLERKSLMREKITGIGGSLWGG